jgi:hypothetical protein
MGEKFNVTSGEVGVFGSLLAFANFSYHFDYTFRLELGEELRKGLVFRIKNNLSFSLAVAKIKKKHASMIA